MEATEIPQDIGTWYRASTVAQILGCSVDRVNQLRKSGDFSYIRTALGILYDPRSVEAIRKARAARQLARQ